MLAWAINELALGGPARGVHVPRRTVHGRHPVRHRQRTTTALGVADDRAELGRHNGADRTRRRIGRRRPPHQGGPAAPGTSTASSGSSPTVTTTTCTRTSCTWC